MWFGVDSYCWVDYHFCTLWQYETDHMLLRSSLLLSHTHTHMDDDVPTNGDRSDTASSFLRWKSAYLWKRFITVAWTHCCWEHSPHSKHVTEKIKHRSRCSYTHEATYTLTMTLATYRCWAVDAGSFAGRSGLHAISGVWWVTQLSWSPSGLHLTNLYTAVAGAPAEVKGHSMSVMSKQISCVYIQRQSPFNTHYK